MTLAVLDPDLKIRGGGRGGGVLGLSHPDPLIRGGGGLEKKFFFWSKNKGGGPPLDPPLL